MTKIPVEKLPGFRKIKELVSEYYEKRLIQRVKSEEHLPEHIGIILDGNRRFADLKNLSTKEGHILGAKKLENVLDWAREIGIKHMTVYAFSKENFQRSSKEIMNLMDLFKVKFQEAANDDRVHSSGVRLRAIGDISSLPDDVVEAIREAERKTKDYEDFSLNIAIGYGGRSELTEAVRKISKEVEEGELSPEEIDKTVIEENLYTADLPDPDLIIRTSGEERLSGFLLWQSAYSELYFCEANWPNFDKINFLRAIHNYQGRERRFGE